LSSSSRGTAIAPRICHAARVTIEKADTVVQAGDVVSVRGGTYMLSARLSIDAKGTAAAPIIFRSHPNEAAILDGTNVSGVNEMLMLYRTERRFPRLRGAQFGVALHHRRGRVTARGRRC
jgi:hypothetical protein